MRTAVLVLGTLLWIAFTPPVGPAQVQSDSTYIVQSSDTLSRIARRFGVSIQDLQSWNKLEGTALQEGQTLRIRPPKDAAPPRDTSTAPDSSTPPTVEPATDTVETPPAPYGRHTVETGESFVTLALRLGTTADTLFALNDRISAPLSPGTSLRFPRRFGPRTHVVKTGETLYSIAGKYGVSVRTLQEANDLDSTAIMPGQRLRLPGRTAPSLRPVGTWASPDTTGAVAVYPNPYAGRLTASGQPYEPDDFVVSHPSLPYGSVVLLSRPDADRHTFARIIDRGPLEEGVLLDVSAAAAEQLGIASKSTPRVALRIVWVNTPSD